MTTTDLPAPTRRTATATLTWTPSGNPQPWNHGGTWRLSVDDPGYTDGRSVGVGRMDRAYNDRAALLKVLAGEVNCYGWDIAAPPDADPLPDVFTVGLVRNIRGDRIDEVDALHEAAGVRFHDAHGAYIDTVADAVASTGLPVAEVSWDGGEPREGRFRIGAEDDDDSGGDDEDSPPGGQLWICWRDTRGWFEVYYSDPQKALGDYAHDLPGDLGPAARPTDVARAVLEIVKPVEPSREPVTGWVEPDGYDDCPELAEDDGWDVSPALERSLVAYITPKDGASS